MRLLPRAAYLPAPPGSVHAAQPTHAGRPPDHRDTQGAPGGGRPAACRGRHHRPLRRKPLPVPALGRMRQRVGIAAALASNPEILIADEPSTALDATTQKEILKLLRSIQERRGMALVLITHDLRVAFSMCDRIYVLYAGSTLEIAPARALEEKPLHPYTLALLVSEPPLDRRLAQLTTVEGSVPSPDDVAGCCPFAPRCAWAIDPCRAEAVKLQHGRLPAARPPVSGSARSSRSWCAPARLRRLRHPRS